MIKTMQIVKISFVDAQDEEKFQREILSDEPNLIKLYLQVANGIQISIHLRNFCHLRK